jgi:hypothetical protein
LLVVVAVVAGVTYLLADLMLAVAVAGVVLVFQQAARVVLEVPSPLEPLEPLELQQLQVLVEREVLLLQVLLQELLEVPGVDMLQQVLQVLQIPWVLVERVVLEVIHYQVTRLLVIQQGLEI